MVIETWLYVCDTEEINPEAGCDIDQILASPSERPTAPTKQGGDEAAPPGPPVKSDVPF